MVVSGLVVKERIVRLVEVWVGLNESDDSIEFVMSFLKKNRNRRLRVELTL